MGNRKRAYAITVAVMVLVAALVNFLEYDTFHRAEAGAEALKGIPMKIDEWVGRDVHLDEEVYKILETRSIIHRSYSADGREVFLSIVYYPDVKVDFHAPESCLGGQGWKVEKSSREVEVSYDGRRVIVELNQLLRRDGYQRTLVYYFYKAGRFLGPSYFQLRFALAANKLANRGTAGSLVRISTPISDDEDQESSELLSGFLGRMFPYVLNAL